MRLLAAALFVVVASVPVRAGEAAYVSLARLDWPEREIYTTLQDMLREVPGVNLSRINFGGRYDSLKINIVIVDTQAFEARGDPIGAGQWQVRFDQLYLNAAALDQNVIALDSDWLSMILVCTNHRQQASRDFPHPKAADKGQHPEQLTVFDQVVDDAWRGEVLNDFIHRSPARAGYRKAASSLLAALRDSRIHDPALYRLRIRIYALAFLPTLIHELAHLDRTGGVLNSHLNNLVAEAFHRAMDALENYRTRMEEDRADAIAVEMLRPVVEKAKLRMIHGVAPEDVRGFSQLISLEEYALIQRDLVLLRVFSDFRGYRFPDVFYSIYHQGCDTSARQPEQIGFYDYTKVAFAFNEPIPMLTRKEYEQLRVGLIPPAMQTHAHAFYRAAQLMRLAQVNHVGDPSTYEIDQFESLLSHIQDGSSPMHFHFDYQLEKMNYTTTDFFRRLNQNESVYGHRYSIERAAICPFNECYVVTQTAVKGLAEQEYFEVYADYGTILEIKYVSPVIKDRSGPANQVKIPDELARWAPNRHLDLYTYLLTNMLQPACSFPRAL